MVLESTTYPGTTDEDLRRSDRGKFESESRCRFPSGIFAGAGGSRVIRTASWRAYQKWWAGSRRRVWKRPSRSTRSRSKRWCRYRSCRVAEAAKLLENIFRSVNIALVNELKMVYAAMGIDIWEVIEAAKTKPFGFMPFYPGPGLGGHCIPIDPFYLTWKAREYGHNTRFIELAGEINTWMPEYVVRRVADALNATQ